MKTMYNQYASTSMNPATANPSTANPATVNPATVKPVLLIPAFIWIVLYPMIWSNSTLDFLGVHALNGSGRWRG